MERLKAFLASTPHCLPPKTKLSLPAFSFPFLLLRILYAPFTDSPPLRHARGRDEVEKEQRSPNSERKEGPIVNNSEQRKEKVNKGRRIVKEK